MRKQRDEYQATRRRQRDVSSVFSRNVPYHALTPLWDALRRARETGVLRNLGAPGALPQAARAEESDATSSVIVIEDEEDPVVDLPQAEERRTTVVRAPSTPPPPPRTPAAAAAARLWTSERLRERPLHLEGPDGAFARNRAAVTSSAAPLDAGSLWCAMRALCALAFLNNQPVAIANWLDMDSSGTERPLRRLRKVAAAAGTLRAPCQWPAVATIGFLEGSRAGAIGHFVSVLASAPARVVTIVDSLKSGSDDPARPALRAFYTLASADSPQPSFHEASRRPVERHFTRKPGDAADIAGYAPIIFRVVRYLNLSAALVRVASEGGDVSDDAAVLEAFRALASDAWEVRVYSHSAPQEGLDCGPLSLALLERHVTSKVPVKRMISFGTMAYRTDPAYAKGLGAAVAAELTILPSKVPPEAAAPAREFLHRTAFEGGHHWLDACKPHASVLTAIDEAVALHANLPKAEGLRRPRVAVHVWAPLQGPFLTTPSKAAQTFGDAIWAHVCYLQWAHRGCDVQVHRHDVSGQDTPSPAAVVAREERNAWRRGEGGAGVRCINVFYVAGDGALVYQLPALQAAAALVSSQEAAGGGALSTVVAATLGLQSVFLAGHPGDGASAPGASLRECLAVARDDAGTTEEKRSKTRISLAFVAHSELPGRCVDGSPSATTKSSAASYGAPVSPADQRPPVPHPGRVLGAAAGPYQHTFCLSVDA